jgi:phage tail tape-measure protein
MDNDNKLMYEAFQKHLKEGFGSAAKGAGKGALAGGAIGGAIGAVTGGVPGAIAGAIEGGKEGGLMGGVLGANKDEEAEGKSKKPSQNTIKAQQLLNQAVSLIMKASDLPDVDWHYSDEDGEIDLQNALENIGEYVDNMRNEDEEGPVKISHVSAQDIKNKPQSGPVKIDWNA